MMAVVVAWMPSGVDLAPKLDGVVIAECRSPASFDVPALAAHTGAAEGPSVPASAKVAQANTQAPPNGGSLGHPIVCSRPCLYFAAGECANGSSCDFCHMNHPKRPHHLDKQHRAMLQNFAPEVRRAWLFAIIRAKLLSLDKSAAMQDIVDELAHSCGAAALALPEPTSMGRQDRLLWAAMSSLTLRFLLFQMQKNLENAPGPAVLNVDRVVAHCQALLETRQ
mmetsp:Transcript_68995/g.135458  ORF Transcript_68995/g.135458 Transcript_68995/m.135458 type:complete len:223 (+) Transcript_68995:56-724(+)|eukprot:CAMPEP_0170237268 /NCGR_PEP_ID=MMETSP0116_2-20130129/18384_1 /TAXON_ID=400756 /ORGANISM="Durinskia baltica, Strain CSIRO CS-38" /LENGTH=222 /DNA_ID=CAMNT_0010488071 /DNA_START=32 /DNA_END=700 /DNA_ORIENTATION=+